MLHIRKAEGNGQSECTRCKANGKYSLTWTSFLYEISGMKGLYCGKCVTLIINESRKDESNDKDIS